MESVFEALRNKKRRRELLVAWVSRTFATSSTYRMLRGAEAEDIRRFLRTRLRDCSGLAKCGTQRAYDEQLGKHTRGLRRSTNIRFGHAAKLVNLYVKEAITRRGVLSTKQARKIRRFAHVPIDSILLKRVWKDFGEDKQGIPIKSTARIKSITPRQYSRFQAFLRGKTPKHACVALDYDLAWAARES